VGAQRSANWLKASGVTSPCGAGRFDRLFDLRTKTDSGDGTICLSLEFAQLNHCSYARMTGSVDRLPYVPMITRIHGQVRS
jgi:hypothetical protein